MAKSKRYLEAEMIQLREKLAAAEEQAKHGEMWDGMPRPEWAQKLLKRAHERVAEENERAAKKKASAAKRVEALKVRLAKTAAALKEAQ
jgi:hypothetical protein